MMAVADVIDFFKDFASVLQDEVNQTRGALTIKAQCSNYLSNYLLRNG